MGNHVDQGRTAHEVLSMVGALPGHVISIIDPDGTVAFVSESVRSTLGYEPDEFSRRLAELIHPDDLDVIRPAWHALREQAYAETQIMVRIQHADGSWHWFEGVGVNAVEVPSIGGMLWNYRDVSDQVAAQSELMASEQRFRTLLERSYDMFLVLDERLDVGWASASTRAVMGYDPEEVVGRAVAEFIHPDDQQLASDNLDRALRGEVLDEATVLRAKRADGSWIWVDVVGADLRDNPLLGGFALCLREVTRRVNAERETQRLLQIFEVSPDPVGIVNPYGKVMYANEAGRRVIGVGPDAPLPSIDLLAFVAPWEADRVRHEVVPTVAARGHWSGELEMLDPDSGERHPALAQVMAHRDSAGTIEYYSAVMRDITERKAFEARLQREITYDSLTGLPNRTLLLDRLTMAVVRAQQHRSATAVLFVDLDNFKVINDSHGHSFGDELLTSIADRLTTTMRPGDTVARFGGDEFVVLCEDLRDERQALSIAERVLDVLDDVFEIGDTEIFVSASVGISYRPVEGDHISAETLLREADAAMYRAKDRGRGQVAVYDETLRTRNLHRLDTETALRRALERDELVVHYQPTVDLSSGAVHGLEALVRWEHPERGLLLPAEFVPVAESTGLIVPLGSTVLEASCRQLAAWRRDFPDLHPISMSVNLSGRQLGDPNLADELERVLDQTRIPPELLTLEMTESLLMHDVEFSHQTLARLRQLRVRVAVDDFGTGYSSLSYLRTFSVDVLKIDRSFVAGLGTEGGDEAIVAAIIRLAHTLGLDAVAEGVETPAQLERLRALGCDSAQGYHLARPQPAASVAPLLGQIFAL